MNGKKNPVQWANLEWAVKHFCCATACSRGFIWFSADRCRGEAFRLINSPHRAGERQEEREGIAKCSHVYPLSEDPLLRAHSLQSGSFLFHPHSHSLSFVTDLQVVTFRCRYGGWEKPLVGGQDNILALSVCQHSAEACFPAERKQKNTVSTTSSVTSLCSGSQQDDGLKRPLLVLVCECVGAGGVSCFSDYVCVCQMELKTNNGLLGAWGVRDTGLRYSHIRDISELKLTAEVSQVIICVLTGVFYLWGQFRSDDF